MRVTPLHVMDFEGSRQSGVVEYGVVTVRAGAIEAVRTRLCEPTGTIGDLERAQHAISESATEGCPPFSEEWNFFSALREEGPLAAHNASVEDGLLRAVWPCPRVSPDFSGQGARIADWGPWVDTLYLYRNLHPGLESYSLTDLIDTFELREALERQAAVYCPEGRDRHHCALYDALASALLLLRLPAEHGRYSDSISWLIEQSAASARSLDSIRQQELF